MFRLIFVFLSDNRYSAPKSQGLLWKEVDKAMAGCDYSYLPNGGDPVGMTDNQYKGILLDQLEDWQEILELAIEAGNTEIQKKAEKQVEKINKKLRF